jgi:hypothetical protein
MGCSPSTQSSLSLEEQQAIHQALEEFAANYKQAMPSLHFSIDASCHQAWCNIFITGTQENVAEALKAVKKMVYNLELQVLETKEFKMGPFVTVQTGAKFASMTDAFRVSNILRVGACEAIQECGWTQVGTSMLGTFASKSIMCDFVKNNA